MSRVVPFPTGSVTPDGAAPLSSELIRRYNRPAPRYTSYPTAPNFHEGIGHADYAAWLDELEPGASLSIYLHVPYCDSLCWFCGCHTKVVRRYEPIADYLDALLQEIDLVAERLGTGHRITHLHWGGGSPTILVPDDMRRLATRLRQRFQFDPDAEFAVEIDPRGLGDAAIRALREIGVNRVSIGVQDVHPEVQQAINRKQPFEVTRGAVERLREAGLAAVNCDLMYGLPYQNQARVLDSVEKVLGLSADRIALFGYAHVPHIKPHQRLIPEAALPDGAERLAQAQAASHRLQAAGFHRIGLDHFAAPGDSLAAAAESGRLHRNFQGYTPDQADVLLGLGASAIGKLPQGYVQNEVPIGRYAAAVREGRLAVIRGIGLDDDDRLRGAIIERIMCDLDVDLESLCAERGVSPAIFEPELERLAPLERDGLVRGSGYRILVTEKGRPFLRSVAAVFDRYLQAEDGRHTQSL
jgi:oxygen-independent coproporphyrinogen-3 oxidase